MAGVILSCGVLVMNDAAELLLCHVTGTPRWDIPKGVGEPGERPLDAAVREAAEETGLALEPDDLLDLGRFGYLRGKDLHLHAALIERIDPRRCVCRTCFDDGRGRSRPEMDGFAWVAFEAVPQRCGKSMAALLTGKLSLPTVLDDLRERVRANGPMRWSWSAG